MAKSAVITLTSAGSGTGPFNLYSDVDSFVTAFETGIAKSSLVAGYTTNLIPDAAQIIRVKSTSVSCTNYIDLVYPGETTTTTTSTTTTTTTGETTTTSTTTSTTTLAPITAYIFFTNNNTAGNKGAKVWLAKSNYYSSGTEASLVEPNVISGSQAGRVPRFTVDVSFWNNDVTNTLDDGLGNLRSPDGTKSVNLSGSYQMAYTSSNGYWRTNNPVFDPVTEAPNIAAFRIDNVTPDPYDSSVVASDASEYTPNPNSNSRIYNIILPDPSTFIRNSNGYASSFETGSTGVTFFDIVSS